MRALVLTTFPSESVGGDLPGEPFPAALLPVGDRPLVQHVIEFLVARGVTEFDFILAGRAFEIERLLGDGTRWGSRFRFHLTRDPERPYRSVVIAAGDRREPFLLAHADRLPEIAAADLAETRRRKPFWVTGEAGEWTGWAVVTGSDLAVLPADIERDQLADHLRGDLETVPVVHELRGDTFAGLLAAHRAVLEKSFPDLLSSGREADPGIWLSRNVSLHPTVRLTPPVFIGENCRVGAEAELGPYTVVGANSILDRRAKAAETFVFPNTYIGEDLELHRAVVDGARLVNVDIGVAVTVTDDFILSRAEARPVHRWAASLWRRFLAGFLLVATAPLLLVTVVVARLARGGPVFHRREAVHLPASSERMLWRTYSRLRLTANPLPSGKLAFLFLHVLPGLWNVARGDVAFVGVDDRTVAELETLSPEWRGLYLKSKGGLLSEALVNRVANATDDDRYAAETCYAVRASFAYDLKLAFRFLGRFLNPFDSLGTPGEASAGRHSEPVK